MRDARGQRTRKRKGKEKDRAWERSGGVCVSKVRLRPRNCAARELGSATQTIMRRRGRLIAVPGR